MREQHDTFEREDEPFTVESFEDLTELEPLQPRPSGLVRSIPFVIAGFSLVFCVAVVGSYLGQNASARTVPLASMSDFNGGVSLVGKTAFMTEEVDLENRGYTYDISQQVTASLKGDMIDNITVIHRSTVANSSQLAATAALAREGNLVITPAAARTDTNLASTTPSIKKLESVWRTGRITRRKAVGRHASNKNEMNCLAKAIYFEARSESKAGQLAVANVVMNRVKSKNFPNSICAVVYENRSKKKLTGCQFSFTCDGQHDNPRRGRQWDQAKKLASKVMRGQKNTRVVNASVMHYHADYVRPKWSYMMRRLTKIGRHIFYTGS